MPTPVFCLMGPTASGKTALACELVRVFPFEIISVDSAMIYRGMDIGTAKPDKAILEKAPHHLINIIEPTETYSAAQFCTDCEKLIEAIESRKKIPLLTGGTMMYFKALQKGLSQLPQADSSLRETYLRQAKEKGWDFLHALLKSQDPVSAARIHPHDTQRIQRALEVYELTGQPLSSFFNEPDRQSACQFINLLIMPDDRKWLHERIALRFEEMLQDGFIEEVQTLMQRYELTLSHSSMRSVGYRQALEYLNGAIDYKVFCAQGVAATRQLAKRQLTWLRHWPDGIVFSAENPTVLNEIMIMIYKILDNTKNR